MGPVDVATAPTQSRQISPPLTKHTAQFFPQNDTVDAPISNNNNSNNQDYDPPVNSASQRALRSEALRFATFQGWPLDFLSPRELSSNGFFYRGIGDQTQCAFCCITISQWEPQDSPADEHRRHAPHCPFVLQLPVGNIPLSGGGSSGIREPARAQVASSSSSSLTARQPFFAQFNVGADTCGGRFRNEIRPNAFPDREESALTIRPPVAVSEGPSSSSAQPDLPSLRVLPHQPARHPELSSLEARMCTFADWPPGLEQRPAQLAEAGFYYMKTGDHVKCFCCDGALRNWEPKDDPWVEHARWFSRCNFLISVKGNDYVKQIQRQFPQSAAPSTECSDSVSEQAVAEDSVKPSEEVAPVKADEDARGDASRLRDALLCQICYDQQLSMVFLPCGHSMSCVSCASALSTCPLCRKRIEATVRAYFPFSS